MFAVGLTLRQRLELDHRAVQMATSSDAYALHLGPTARVPAQTHGNYRAQPGGDTSVLTTTALPAPPRGESYQAWALIDEEWIRLGEVRPDAKGKSLLVATSPKLGRMPQRVEVTREKGNGGAIPSGAVALVWPAE